MSNEDKFSLEVLTDFFDAVEAGISAARQRIKERKCPEPEPDFSKLPWEQKQGEKGPFEQTSEKAAGNNDVWKQLKAKLKQNQGFWQHAGYKFWFDMKNENVIDRRKV
jgi:hypothetical protein